jgi:ribosomal protein S27E
MSDLFEIEEPEAMPASHLVKTKCRRCRVNDALCAPESAEKALCTDCHGQSVVMPAAGRSVGYTPVVRYGVTPHAAAPEEQVPYPQPVSTSVDAVPPDMLVPAPVIALHALAAEHGWSWSFTYSRGWMPHGDLREIRANSEKLRKARAAERPKVNKIKEHG